MLDHLTIFQELSYDQKEAIMLCMTEVRTPTGENLIVQGETGNAFYIVESGQFNIYVDDKQVATSEEGGSFGELALVMDQLRAATVTAAKDSLCWKLDRGAQSRARAVSRKVRTSKPSPCPSQRPSASTWRRRRRGS